MNTFHTISRLSAGLDSHRPPPPRRGGGHVHPLVAARPHGNRPRPYGMRQCSFTLPEALAALVMAAIVVPVVMHAASVAGRASELARHTEQAARLADVKLQDLVATGDWQHAEPSGEFEDYPGFTWEFEAVDWGEDDELVTAMTQLSVTVRFSLRNREELVGLTTLVQGGEE